MECTSSTHTSGNGKTTLGYLQLRIGRVNALVADGTQAGLMRDFIRQAQETLENLRQQLDAGTFSGVLPIMSGDIELDLGFSSTPVTRQRDQTGTANVITTYFETADGGCP